LKKLWLIFFVLLCPYAAYCAGGVGPDFLRVSPPAKAASMGNAHCAVPSDINSLLHNPAGICRLENPVMSITHFASFADTNYEYGAIAWPLGSRQGTAGFGIFLDYTFDFTEYDEFGDEVGNVENFDVMGIGSYAYPVYNWLSAGVNIKYFYSKLYHYDKMGLAVDAGALALIAKDPDTFGGICVQNIGFQEAYIKVADQMPVNLKAGISTRFTIKDAGKIRFSLDVNRLWIKDELPTLDLGVDSELFEIFSVRVGYGFRHDISSVSLGIGLILDKVRFSYAYQPYDALGVAHRISIDIELY